MKQDRALESLAWVLAALLLAGVVHLVSVLLMPAVAPRDAFNRLTALAKASPEMQGGVTLLEPATPGAPTLPFDDPAMAQGVCLFDLAEGPVRLTATVNGEDYLGLSFHSASGVTFHAATDRSASNGKINIVVGDARQIEDLEEDEGEDAPLDETRITAPALRGFVLIRALAKRPSDFERARETVKAVRCEALPRQP